MDRTELRLRILSIYYEDFHGDENILPDPEKIVSELPVSRNEIIAAEVWLIDSAYLNGENSGNIGSRTPMPFVNRINNVGINVIESIMDKTFLQVEPKIENFTKLSKPEKIRIFVEKCLRNPLTEEICKIALATATEQLKNLS